MLEAVCYMQIIFVKFSFFKNFMTLHIFSCHNTFMKSSVLIWKASFFKWRKKLYEFTQCLFPRMLSYQLSFTFFTVHYFLWIILCWLVCLKIRTGKPIFSTFSRIPLTFLSHQKCPNTELFLVRIFLHSHWIWRFTEYGDLQSKSPYSVWMQENTDQK